MPSGSWQVSVSQGKIFDLLYSLAENQMVYWKFSCAKLSPICVKEKKGETLVQIHLINMKCRINYDHSSDYILSTFSVMVRDFISLVAQVLWGRYAHLVLANIQFTGKEVKCFHVIVYICEMCILFYWIIFIFYKSGPGK